MAEIKLNSTFDVELQLSAGNDEFICKAARVSTLASAAIDSKESEGLIRFLMNNRHGTPFEHGFMTFRIKAPIFVWREFMRHRIGFSYNEQSGRYMEMLPEFYVPYKNRPLIQIGKPGHYEFVPGDVIDRDVTHTSIVPVYETAWRGYKFMLSQGIAKEVARICLPMGTYSSAFVSCNPRSLMSFLSLRTKHEDSKFPSYPQWEIEQVANQMEEIFAGLFPITHKAFNDAGRVSP